MPRKSKAQVEIEKQIEDLDRQICDIEREVERLEVKRKTLDEIILNYDNLLKRIQGDEKDGKATEGSTD
jgi:prefoldin subunit 5